MAIDFASRKNFKEAFVYSIEAVDKKTASKYGYISRKVTSLSMSEEKRRGGGRPPSILYRML